MENYKQIKADLDELRLLVEKSELWVYKAKSGEGKKDKKKKEDGDKVSNNSGNDKVVRWCNIIKHFAHTLVSR